MIHRITNHYVSIPIDGLLSPAFPPPLFAYGNICCELQEEQLESLKAQQDAWEQRAKAAEREARSLRRQVGLHTSANNPFSVFITKTGRPAYSPLFWLQNLLLKQVAQYLKHPSFETSQTSLQSPVGVNLKSIRSLELCKIATLAQRHVSGMLDVCILQLGQLGTPE